MVRKSPELVASFPKNAYDVRVLVHAAVGIMPWTFSKQRPGVEDIGRVSSVLLITGA